MALRHPRQPLECLHGGSLGIRTALLLCLLLTDSACRRPAIQPEAAACHSDEVSLLHVNTALIHRGARGNKSAVSAALALNAGLVQGRGSSMGSKMSLLALLEPLLHSSSAAHSTSRRRIIKVVVITIFALLLLLALAGCCRILCRRRRRKAPYRNSGGNGSTLLPPPGLDNGEDSSSEDSLSDPVCARRHRLCPRINEAYMPEGGVFVMNVPSLSSGMITQEQHVLRKVTTDRTLFFAKKLGPSQHPDETTRAEALESVFLYLPRSEDEPGPELLRLVLTYMPQEEVQLQCQIYHEGDQLWGSVTGDQVAAPMSAGRPFTLYTRRHGSAPRLKLSASSAAEKRRNIVDLRVDTVIAETIETSKAAERWQVQCFQQADVISIVALMLAADRILDYEKFKHWRT